MADEHEHVEGTRRIVFDAGDQGRKVWGLLLFAALCALGASWAGWAVAVSYGPSPAGGDDLPSWPERWAMAGLVASVGWIFLVGMMAYGRRYVARVEQDGSGGIWVRPLLAWGPAAIAVPLPSQCDYHDPRPLRPRLAVYAPWESLRVPGYPLPFILDVQGLWRERAAWDRAITAAARTANPPTTGTSERRGATGPSPSPSGRRGGRGRRRRR